MGIINNTAFKAEFFSIDTFGTRADTNDFEREIEVYKYIEYRSNLQSYYRYDQGRGRMYMVSHTYFSPILLH